MRERAEAAGGRFEMSSTPGSGTTVEFWMPEKNGGKGRYSKIPRRIASATAAARSETPSFS